MYPTSLLLPISILLLSSSALLPAPANPPPPHHPLKRSLLTLPNSPTDTTNNTTTTAHRPSPLNTTTTNLINPDCYPPDPTLPLIHPADCYAALYTLLVHPNAMFLHHWDRTSDLPVEYASGTCSVILARAAPGADDVFQLVLVAHAAAVVVGSCVTERWGYQGGVTRVGVREGFVIYVSRSENGVGVGSA